MEKPSRKEFESKDFTFVPYKCQECGDIVNHKPSNYLQFKNKLCLTCSQEHYN